MRPKVSVSLIKKEFLLYRKKFMQVRAFKRYIPLKVGCTGLFESTLVKMPHCWKSHVMAQLYQLNETIFPIQGEFDCMFHI